MNIDERLDRLTERHEALTQTVEIMAHMQRENEQRNQAAHEKIQALLTSVVESIANLARIVEGHERRISRLEEGSP
jgi:hypothetical protein